MSPTAARLAETLFVTGTDTDAGKTWVACALLSRLRAEGVSACGYKPVASGCIATPGGWRSEDALALIAASGSRAAYGEINPYAFAPAIAPHLAAAEAGQRIDTGVLDAAHRRLAERHAVVIAEGAGGWLTPLDEQQTLGDWAAGQGWPVLLVVGMRLGCLNHALLSAEAIRRRGRLAGWVANVRDPALPQLAGNLDSLSRRLGPPLWVQTDSPLAPAEVLPALFDLRGLSSLEARPPLH